MNILFRWNMRMLREDPLHAVFTIFNLVFSYMLLTSLKLFTQGGIKSDNTDGDGLVWYFAAFLSVVVIATTLLTMYNAFLTSIYERKRRYERLSAAGATIGQIRGSLFLEALIFNCVGALVGIALGLALVVAIKIANKIPEDQSLFYWLQQQDRTELLKKGMALLSEQIKLLLPRARSEIEKAFGGYSYVPTPQRGVYCLLPEFLSVLMVMIMAAGRHMPNRTKKRQETRRLFRADQLSLGGLLGRLFGAGGMINRWMDKRERKRRRLFLSVFAVGVATMAIAFNVSHLWMRGVFTDKNNLYLHTSGDNIRFEKQVDKYLNGAEFRRVAEEVQIYHCYLPRVYCRIGDDQIAQPTKDLLRRKSVRYQPFLYPVSGSDTNLVMPQLLFVQEGKFDLLRSEFGGEGDIGAVLLPGTGVKGNEFAWLDSDKGIQEWELCFYSDPEARYKIYDARTKKEAKSAENMSDEDKALSDKVQPKFSYTDVNHTNTRITDAVTFLKAVESKPTEKITVNVWQLPPEETKLFARERDREPFSALEWDINRALPTLVFPESAQRSFTAHLRDTNEGVRMSAQSREDNLQLFDSLRIALWRGSEGCVAEKPLGLGTRYLCGENRLPKDEPSYAVPFLHVFNYKTPKQIYADVYLRPGPFVDLEMICIFVIAVALILFALLTNIINAVHGHHILRQHDHAVLRSCGMSEKQMHKSILYEAIWYSVHSVIYGFAGYLLFFPVILAGLSFGTKYEHILWDTRLLAEWCSDPFANVQHVYGNLLYSVISKRVWPVFLAAAAIMLMLFLATNVVFLRRMREDALVELLKKDI